MLEGLWSGQQPEELPEELPEEPLLQQQGMRQTQRQGCVEGVEGVEEEEKEEEEEDEKPEGDEGARAQQLQDQLDHEEEPILQQQWPSDQSGVSAALLKDTANSVRWTPIDCLRRNRQAMLRLRTSEVLQRMRAAPGKQR
jgi:hypothetical protein